MAEDLKVVVGGELRVKGAGRRGSAGLRTVGADATSWGARAID